MREFQRRWTAEHGEPYTARYRDKRREADRAAIAAGRGARHRNPEAAKASDQLRRAQRAGVDAERVKASEVFERDGWRCGVCGRKVDPALKYPDLMSATLDHVVPLSQGGAHTRANARCAHLTCNSSRGAKGGAEQLRVVG